MHRWTNRTTWVSLLLATWCACASTETTTRSSSDSSSKVAAAFGGANSCSHGDCEFNDRYKPCCDRYKECGEAPRNLKQCDACISCIDKLEDNPEGCAKKFTCE
jgi:hypothetical protein